MRNLTFLLILFLFLNIQLDVVHAESETSQLDKVVKETLPGNAELIKPNESESSSSILSYDFDQDGEEEMIITYRKSNQLNKLHVLLLKKEEQDWNKVWDVTREGFDIEFSGLEDVTGDGLKDYLLALRIGASAGNKLEIYEWEDATLKRIMKPRYYHEMELLKDGTHTYLALWERYCCDAFIVDVLKWDEKQMVTNEELYLQYFPKVKEFYETKIEKMDAWYYWYVLADAQLKANLLEDARESIQKGLTFLHGTEEFNKLKKRLEEKMIK